MWLAASVSCTTATNPKEPPPEPPPRTLIESFRLGSRVIKSEEFTDAVLPLLSRYESNKPTVSADPDIVNSLIVNHHYRLNGKEYTLECKCLEDPGPYRVFAIYESDPKLEDRFKAEYESYVKRRQQQ